MQSMTGFGRGSAQAGEWLANVEAGSVNRKQAEVVVQMSREFSSLETEVRKTVLDRISRGRVNVSISLERAGGDSAVLKVDASLAKALHDAFREISILTGEDVLPAASDYLRHPGLIATGSTESDPQDAWRVIEPALRDAVEALVTMRSSEGAHLKADLEARIGTLAAFAARISTDAADRPARQRELLLKRLRDASLDLDPADERVVKEIALFADRCDVSEELTRLDSHFAKFREYLDGEEAPGRPLDFLCQELFREFNTIGSKANDAGIAQTVVEAKTELEKIREQVQNVE
ncbi:MAG: YicC family protein [Verrucomicrobiae bacterium]|nr:YicC family protein [Verrucomicrobiae bacterium]MCP5533560.1 YicC family protein [Akkermansiaceae bacterium]MCP5542478.1 YicC family protein [Akkermansiaceae bacterium]MCP5545987.1 YicC family protein [Akkermansiaceae bacterium]